MEEKEALKKYVEIYRELKGVFEEWKESYIVKIV
jgi:hypothetical protein